MTHIEKEFAAGLSPSGKLKRYPDRALDAQRLTMLGVLLTLGVGVGFGVGGRCGVAWGIVSGIVAPGMLMLAFRWHWTRNLLARVADWPTSRR